VTGTRSPYSGVLLCAAAFVVLAAAILFAVPPERPVVAGADSTTWLKPAKALLQHGALVDHDNPEIADFYRPPMMALFSAPLLWIGGDYGIRAIVLGQVVLIALAGILVGVASGTLWPGTATLATALFLFASWLCAIYVVDIVELGATYGSVATVVIFLIWLSWSVNAVFFGGALATEVEIGLKDAKLTLLPDLRGERPIASGPEK